MNGEKKNSLGVIIRILVLCGIVGGAIYFFRGHNIHDITPIKIKNYIHSFGASGPIIFVCLYGLRSLVLFPSNIFSTAAGLAFGTLLGWLCNYVGAVLSAIIGFWTARLLGREFIVRLLGKKLAGFDALVDKRGFAIVFYLRFFAPFDPLSYACGLSKMPFGQYMIATLIPIIPGTLAFAYFGSAFTKIATWHDLLHKQFVIPAVVLVVTFFIPVAVKKLWPGKTENV